MAENRNERMQEITQRLEQGVKEIFTSEMYMEYLKTMSKFHNYSFNNTMLIHMQKPDATLVAGYQAWQKKFKRQVKRGEKGIQIITPAPIREREEVEKIDPETQEPVLKSDGTPETEEVVYTIPRFRVMTVFDVSQTYGEPLPEIETPELMGSVENYDTFLQAVREVSPVPIRFDNIESGAKGYYSSSDKEIVIQEGMSERQTMKTGIHETVHAKLHDRDVMEELGEKKSQMTKEVEAESTAYVVCQYFGLDTSDYSFPYIAGWSSDMEMRELRASMDTIRRTAGELIDQMVERMREIQREAQRQSETALFESREDRYGIYQLADEGNGQAYRFMGMAYLQERGLTVDGADYRFVYGDVLEKGESLESLYQKFNMEHPQDYTGHSLSVSDVVIIKKDGELTAHYVDSFGYQELPDFPRQRKGTAQVDKDTKGLLVEGHFGTWHTAETREIMGAPFFRMEHDTYGNTVAGIIVNEKGKLVAEDLEHGFDEGALEAIQEYLQEESPMPFLKQFYVVNDAYGIQAEREYQYFERLEDALEAYHSLPNHLPKQIGMESNEGESSRMTLLRCENGIDTIEDIGQASLSGKWMNPETEAAVKEAEDYLNSRDTEVAYELAGGKAYLFVQTTGEGYDYTFYDMEFHALDGGILENQELSFGEAVEDILEGGGFGRSDGKVIECEKFLETVERAEAVLERQKAMFAYYGNLDEKVKIDLIQKIFRYQTEHEPGSDMLKYWNGEPVTEDAPEIYQVFEVIDFALERKDAEPFLKHLETVIGEHEADEPIAKDAAKLLEDLRKALQEPVKEPTISFYVAECMEFPVLGEYHDNLTLEEAVKLYDAIPADRRSGIKGIGFCLEDGSDYDGEYELMRAGVVSKDLIDLVPHYKESPLVQKAVADLEHILSQRQEQAKETEKTAEKGGGTKQSVIQALSQWREKQKEKDKAEQRNMEQSGSRKKGEMAL